jgi:hypothetical protein
MRTIAICLPVYGKAVSENFADKLWDGLKIEVSLTQDVQHLLNFPS